jgi:anti-anti-sigma factor
VVDGTRGAPVAEVAAALLGTLLGDDGPRDDVAVVVARLLPAPLRLDVVADPAHLRPLRSAVRGWAQDAGLDAGRIDDLLLAVGEAAANSVEHAYGDRARAGRVRVDVALDPGGAVTGEVADEGSWRPPPADPGFRGRGLRLVRELADEVRLLPGPSGTVVRFRMSPPTAAPSAPFAVQPDDGQPAAVVVSSARNGRCVEVTGDLDLAGVVAVRDRLLAALSPGAEPVTLDLTGLGSLASSGLGLLLEAARRHEAGVRLEVLLPDGGPARRLLDMTGLTSALRPGG